MIWPSNARCKRLSALNWHDWFAWRPVLIDGQWVWLTTVWRRHVCGCEICYWIYRLDACDCHHRAPSPT